ncbi:hypothetical protein D3C78_1584220 [compost metagenome]
MAQQPTGLTDVLDFRGRLRSDVAKLELPNFGGQVCVAIRRELPCRLVSSLAKPISEHLPAHPQARVVGDKAGVAYALHLSAVEQRLDEQAQSS